MERVTSRENNTFSSHNKVAHLQKIQQESLMGVDLFQLHGVRSTLLDDDPKKLQLGLLRPLMLQRQRFSTASSPAIQQEQRHPATSIAALSVASAVVSSSHSQDVVCHKCQGHCDIPKFLPN